MKKMPILLELVLVFMKIGVVTFGGGLAMLPILEKELIEKRKWTTKEKLLDYFAIGQATPGIIAVNVATFLGYEKAGVWGGILTTLGVVTPSIVIITVISIFFSNFADISWVQKALAGINIAVAALLCKVVWGFRKQIFGSALAAILSIASFCLIVFFNVHTVVIILGALCIGLIIFFVKKKRLKNNCNSVQLESKDTSELKKEDDE